MTKDLRRQLNEVKEENEKLKARCSEIESGRTFEGVATCVYRDLAILLSGFVRHDVVCVNRIDSYRPDDHPLKKNPRKCGCGLSEAVELLNHLLGEECDKADAWHKVWDRIEKRLKDVKS